MTGSEETLGFGGLVLERFPEMPEAIRGSLVQYREMILAENRVQNLTRITEPLDFIESNVVDCVEIIKSGFLGSQNVDLGSGAGVPGLLCALLDPLSAWVLTESEGSKADFLKRTVDALGLGVRVQVFQGRGEAFLGSTAAQGGSWTVVSRAVGPVSRIMGWIGECSTWNTLILLKGPAWEEEWKKFQSTRWRKRLSEAGNSRYEVGSEKKKRVIVRLKREAGH